MSDQTVDAGPPASDNPERFDPAESGGRLVDAEHRARYALAARLARGRTTLDAACGTGYGTRMLLEGGARRVVAVDIAEEALEETRSRVGKRAEVVAGDLGSLPFEDGTFELVVCFEAIEHVDDRNGALDELRRVLADDGLLVLSSPNRGVYPPGNPHHVYEYGSDELEAALRERFVNVLRLRQHPWLATAIDGGRADPVVGRLEDVELGAETFTVAIASDASIEEPAGQIVLADAFEVGWWHEQTAALTERAEAAEERAAEEEERAAAAQLRLDDLEAEMAELMKQLGVAHRDGGHTRGLLEEMGGRLLEFEARTVELADLRRRFDEVREERARYEGEVRAVLEERDQQLAQTLANMTSSLSWRMTRPLRAVKRLLRRR